MVNPNPGFLSKRVKRRDPSGITSDRYEFLGLDQAEPDLGNPLIGVSSIGSNPYTGNVSDLYFVASSGDGKRYWTKQTSIIAGGTITPGSITVRNNGSIVGDASLVKDVNFVGSGVTVNVNPSIGSSGVNVQITVTDVSIPSGDTGSIGYKDDSGLLQGSTDFVYDSITQRVGVGSTVPTEKLDVEGNVRIGNNLTVDQSLSAGSFNVGNFQIGENGLIFNVTSGGVGIGTSQAKATLDVLGNTNITGILTVTNRVSTAQLNATNVSATNANISGVTTSGSFNVGSNEVISASRQLRNITSLDATTTATIESAIQNAPNIFNDISVAGIATFQTNIGVSGLTTTTNLSVSGIASISNLSVTGVATVGTSSTGVTLNTNGNLTATGTISAGLSTSRNSWVSGTSTITTAVINRVQATNIGIGTTNPRSQLDVVGDVRLSGVIYDYNGSSGTFGQVLISNGTSPVAWGSPGSITAGSATSISVFNTEENRTYYPVLARTTNGITTVSADITGLYYNPSVNSLGIGTTGTSANLNVQGTANVSGNVSVGGTLSELYAGQYWNVVTQADVGYGATQVPLNQYLGQLAFMDEYLPPQFRNTEVVTTSTSTVTLDSIPSLQVRSAKYNIQITCNGQLVGSGSSASSASVRSLVGGTRYVHGTYTNIALTTQQGTGNDARANIIVNREYQLSIDSIINGVFNTAESTTGIQTGSPVIFNRLIPTSAAENSKVTSIRVTNPGTGYTTIPSIQITNPTNNPPISGVSGIGSTATAVVSAMELNNVYVNIGVSTSVGVGTIGIPTVSFARAVGGGITATGRVGFGVSSIAISNPGFGITSLPTISFSGERLVSPTAGISSIFVSNVYVTNTGFGYSSLNYPTVTFQPPTSGVSAAATVTSLGISEIFNIVSPGSGYTVSPRLTVSSPSVGIDTATLSATLGIVTFTVTNPGSGYTVAPVLSVSPTPTNFSARVGMGITLTNVQLTGGSNYSNTPTFTINPVGGIGTGAQITLVSKNPDTNAITEVAITNPGTGYTVPPNIVITDSTGVGAALTITRLFFTNINVFNIGYGLTQTPNVSLVDPASLGFSAAATPVLGIGSITVVGFGSGYNSTPSIAVTAFDGVTGTGGSVTSLGLGVTSGFIRITNPGVGYTFIPSVSFNSPVGVGTSAIGITGAGITGIIATVTGIGFSNTVPTVSFTYPTQSISPIIGVAASITSIRVTNVYIDTIGTGYTAADLASSGIVTFSTPGVGATVGYGVSTISIVNLGIGYTLAPTVTIGSPNIGVSTAVGIASLGYPGILPGVAFTTGTSQIYYVAQIPSSNSLILSSGVGVGTLTRTDVADSAFLTDKPNAFVGGQVSLVNVVSPGSGYTSRSIVSASNFDSANVGTGFSFVASPVNNFQISDVMILQTVGSATTTCEIMEYATLANEEILGSFGANISGQDNNIVGNLTFTPTYRDNTIKISRNKIDI